MVDSWAECWCRSKLNGGPWKKRVRRVACSFGRQRRITSLQDPWKFCSEVLVSFWLSHRVIDSIQYVRLTRFPRMTVTYPVAYSINGVLYSLPVVFILLKTFRFLLRCCYYPVFAQWRNGCCFFSRVDDALPRIRGSSGRDTPATSSKRASNAGSSYGAMDQDQQDPVRSLADRPQNVVVAAALQAAKEGRVRKESKFFLSLLCLLLLCGLRLTSSFISVANSSSIDRPCSDSSDDEESLAGTYLSTFGYVIGDLYLIFLSNSILLQLKPVTIVRDQDRFIIGSTLVMSSPTARNVLFFLTFAAASASAFGWTSISGGNSDVQYFLLGVSLLFSMGLWSLCVTLVHQAWYHHPRKHPRGEHFMMIAFTMTALGTALRFGLNGIELAIDKPIEAVCDVDGFDGYLELAFHTFFELLLVVVPGVVFLTSRMDARLMLQRVLIISLGVVLLAIVGTNYERIGELKTDTEGQVAALTNGTLIDPVWIDTKVYHLLTWARVFGEWGTIFTLIALYGSVRMLVTALLSFAFGSMHHHISKQAGWHVIFACSLVIVSISHAALHLSIPGAIPNNSLLIPEDYVSTYILGRSYTAVMGYLMLVCLALMTTAYICRFSCGISDTVFRSIHNSSAFCFVCLFLFHGVDNTLGFYPINGVILLIMCLVCAVVQISGMLSKPAVQTAVTLFRDSPSTVVMKLPAIDSWKANSLGAAGAFLLVGEVPSQMLPFSFITNPDKSMHIFVSNPGEPPKGISEPFFRKYFTQNLVNHGEQRKETDLLIRGPFQGTLGQALQELEKRTNIVLFATADGISAMTSIFAYLYHYYVGRGTGVTAKLSEDNSSRTVRFFALHTTETGLNSHIDALKPYIACWSAQRGGAHLPALQVTFCENAVSFHQEHGEAMCDPLWPGPHTISCETKTANASACEGCGTVRCEHVTDEKSTTTDKPSQKDGWQEPLQCPRCSLLEWCKGCGMRVCRQGCDHKCSGSVTTALKVLPWNPPSAKGDQPIKLRAADNAELMPGGAAADDSNLAGAAAATPVVGGMVDYPKTREGRVSEWHDIMLEKIAGLPPLYLDQRRRCCCGLVGTEPDLLSVLSSSFDPRHNLVLFCGARRDFLFGTALQRMDAHVRHGVDYFEELTA